MTLAVNIAQIGSNNTTFRNRIINGGMVLDQRNAGSSVSVSTSGVYVLDRWKNRANGGGVFSVQQSSTAPAGFNTAVAYTVTTADSSIAAGDNYWIIQDIEGFNVADLGWGTANAQTVTVSFWVRASVTGTYNVALSNGIAYDRSFVSTYTVNAANTYEYKTITITGDTSGTWLKTNGGGISLVFNLGAGTSFQATANTWSAGFLQSTSGSTNLIATNGATFYITGVQLEAGSTASPFEYRLYGTELQLAQRYYQFDSYVIWSGNVTNANTYYMYKSFAVPMRATPTLVYAAVGQQSFQIAASVTNQVTFQQVSFGRSSNATAAAGFFIDSITMSAEL